MHVKPERWRDKSWQISFVGSALLGVFMIALGCGNPSRGASAAASPLDGDSPALERFGIGRPVTASEIAAWDLDVGPDGIGLPQGEGSVDAGRSLYAIQCQHCHGVDGAGGPFDPLAGRIDGDAFPFATDPTVVRTIGSYWPYATTVFDYVRRAMPLERPGSLSNEQVYALTAYLLHLNGLVEADQRLDRESLRAIVMPARDRFVSDDRTGGGEIR